MFCHKNVPPGVILKQTKKGTDTKCVPFRGRVLKGGDFGFKTNKNAGVYLAYIGVYPGVYPPPKGNTVLKGTLFATVMVFGGLQPRIAEILTVAQDLFRFH